MVMQKASQLKIIDYSTEYRKVFRDLNVEWISTYFRMEESDHKALDEPDQYIIDKGGFIFVALYLDEPVGVCALIKMNEGTFDYELAKMAVSPRVQGNRIGWHLGQAVINKAKSLGASTLFLESNTILVPAITLYRKLGFVEVYGYESPYERSNIQMTLSLSDV
jgi:GNAT superfamily N-acetyltransferase